LVLLLNESEVTSILTMENTLNIVEEALRDHGEGHALNYPRYRLISLNTILNVMSAGLPRIKSSGLKVYAASKAGARFLVLLLDCESGEWLSIMAANKLGQMRTGATSGIATKYLARKNAGSLGIYGSGWQARSQVEAISKIRKLHQIQCYSPNPSHAKSFALEVTDSLGIETTPVEKPQSVADGADIIVTVTDAKEPVVRGEWLQDGVHLNGVGANDLRRRELDSSTIAKCDLIFVDSIEQSKLESGDLVTPVSEGILEWRRVRELGPLVAGKVEGRSTQGQISLFKSNGLAIEDVAVARHIYDRAVSLGVGKEIEFFK
jgi:ornithine cyclodeaminase/alanine dehydrogenase-like protein (mu-crystallin family)